MRWPGMLPIMRKHQRSRAEVGCRRPVYGVGTLSDKTPAQSSSSSQPVDTLEVVGQPGVLAPAAAGEGAPTRPRSLPALASPGGGELGQLGESQVAQSA
jgi:hypothetical protein